MTYVGAKEYCRHIIVDIFAIPTYDQCMYTTRNCKDPPNHVCHGVIKTPVEEQRIYIKKDVAHFIGKANLALRVVEQDYFNDFMESLIEL